jgi:hypothetical protein
MWWDDWEEAMNKAVIAGVVMVLAASTAAVPEVDISSANFMLPGCKSYADATDGPGRSPFNGGMCAGMIDGILYYNATFNW